ncbi:MAG: c-type cytochrome [Bacteroidetes bacterium]|nr:c-type cytochrome [Bacteroidota bacterium]
MKKLYIKHVLAFYIGLLITGQAVAQSTPAPVSDIQNQVISLLVFSMIGLALTILVMTLTIFALIRKNAEQTAAAAEGETAAAGVQAEPSPYSLAGIRAWLWDIVPIEKESDIDLGHDYDGIRELDNNLPPWWKYGFYLSIAFAVVYLFVFHGPGADWTSKGQYDEEMAEAAIQKEEYLKRVANLVNEQNVEVLTDGVSLNNGKNIYMTNCIACHGAEGQGGIGPNFSDQYWLHGGSINDIFTTIKYGVPEKGMISWQDQLKPKQMQEVASFILTFQGTNPPNPKDPQGDLYVPVPEDPQNQEVDS